MTLFVQREILLLETTILNLFILKPAATPKRCTRPPENVSYPETFSAPHCLPFLYPVPLSVWWNSFVQRASVFDPFCLIIIYHTFSLTAFLTFPLATLFTTSKCIQRSVRRLSSCWFFFLSRFALSFLTPAPAFLLPSKHLPANTGTERQRGGRERERKKKTNFLAFSRQWLSKKPPLAHRSWLHSFPNANQMWSTNVWQRFFFFFPSKEDKCRPKM